MTKYEKTKKVSLLLKEEAKNKDGVIQKMYIRMADYFEKEANSLTLAQAMEIL